MGSKVVTDVTEPRPLHFVPAPACCDTSLGISAKIFAIHDGSVSGVESSRFGSRYRLKNAMISKRDMSVMYHCVPASPNRKVLPIL